MTEEFPTVELRQICSGDSIKVENSDKSAFAVGYVQSVESVGPGNRFITISTADSKIGGLTWWVGENDTYWRLSKGVEQPFWWDSQEDGQGADIPVRGYPALDPNIVTLRARKHSHDHYVAMFRYRDGTFTIPRHLTRDEWKKTFERFGTFTPRD